MLGVMYVLVRRAFPVAFEWRRLAHLVVVVGGLTVLGADLLPDGSFVWFIARGAVFVLIGPALLGTGFLHRSELQAARGLIAKVLR
jgi:hypothetical protein